jgi:hypothetical protein
LPAKFDFVASKFTEIEQRRWYGARWHLSR